MVLPSELALSLDAGGTHRGAPHGYQGQVMSPGVSGYQAVSAGRGVGGRVALAPLHRQARVAGH